jgi:hypothetical protein
MLPVKNQILQVLSYRAIETQIMVPVKQTLEETKEDRCLQPTGPVPV